MNILPPSYFIKVSNHFSERTFHEGFHKRNIICKQNPGRTITRELSKQIFATIKKTHTFVAARNIYFFSHLMPVSTDDDSIFNQLEAFGHKKVVYCSDPDTGLKAIIAIHDTTLGPA